MKNSSTTKQLLLIIVGLLMISHPNKLISMGDAANDNDDTINRENNNDENISRLSAQLFHISKQLRDVIEIEKSINPKFKKLIETDPRQRGLMVQQDELKAKEQKLAINIVFGNDAKKIAQSITEAIAIDNQLLTLSKQLKDHDKATEYQRDLETYEGMLEVINKVIPLQESMNKKKAYQILGMKTGESFQEATNAVISRGTTLESKFPAEKIKNQPKMQVQKFKESMILKIAYKFLTDLQHQPAKKVDMKSKKSSNGVSRD